MLFSGNYYYSFIQHSSSVILKNVDLSLYIYNIDLVNRFIVCRPRFFIDSTLNWARDLDLSLDL